MHLQVPNIMCVFLFRLLLFTDLFTVNRLLLCLLGKRAFYLLLIYEAPSSVSFPLELR